MHLRKLKVLISCFFLTVLTVGMADFSLHALTHEHAELHESEHVDCDHSSVDQKGVNTIFNTEQKCLLCGHFVVHTAWAVADLVSVQSPDYSEIPVLFSNNQLISNKLPCAFLRGPPEV